MCTYIAVVNYVMIASAVLQRQSELSISEAGMIFTLPYVVSAIVSPFVGAYVNKYGKRMSVTLLGSFVMLFAHCILFFIPILFDGSGTTITILHIIPLILLGFSYSTYSVVLWGSLPYMVEARTLGTAFGICTAFQNLGTLLASPVIGMLT